VDPSPPLAYYIILIIIIILILRWTLSARLARHAVPLSIIYQGKPCPRAGLKTFVKVPYTISRHHNIAGLCRLPVATPEQRQPLTGPAGGGYAASAYAVLGVAALLSPP
jgi:hypothetical protein